MTLVPRDVLKNTPGAGPAVMPLDEAVLEAYCVKNIPGFKAPLLWVSGCGTYIRRLITCFYILLFALFDDMLSTCCSLDRLPLLFRARDASVWANSV